jgi:hypothetical protein
MIFLESVFDTCIWVVGRDEGIYRLESIWGLNLREFRIPRSVDNPIPM